MLAAYLKNGEFEIGDVPMPEYGSEDALIRIRAAGVCHSDLHLVRGDWFGRSGNLPLGHEGVGVVEALGADVDQSIEVGDRVIFGLGGVGGAHWCGACRYCLRGRPHLCERAKVLMGTFAEYIAVWAPALVKLPNSLSDQEVGLACGGLTAYGAIKKLSNFGILPGQPIAVIGAAGGLGHYAVQIASAFGYEVIGVDIGHERLDFIRSLGAVVATDPDNALGFVHEMYGGVDASVVFATKISAFQLGFKMLAPGGLMVCVGIPGTSEGKIELSPMTFSRKEATITYSSAGTVEDMRQLMCLAQAGRVRSHVSRVSSLSDLPTIFDELEKAQYLGRAVLTNLSG